MQKSKYIAAIVAALVTATMLTGCADDKRNSEKDAYRQYGINCIEKGDYPAAVEAFQKALDQSVGSIGEKELDICYYKAKAQYLSNDADAAINTYTAIIDYNDDADAYYLRGCVYFAKNDYEKGSKDFESAVAEDKKNYEIYIGIYETLSKYGMSEEAQGYLDRALKIEGSKANDYMQRGRIYTILGDYESAEENLKKAIDEDLVKANYYMGQLYVVRGDDSGAEQYFEKYLDSGDVDSYELMNMGESQMEKENYSTAVTYFQRALDMENVPNRQQLLKNMIIAYEYDGDFASAKNQMEVYLEEFPDDSEAAREYQFLETR